MGRLRGAALLDDRGGGAGLTPRDGGSGAAARRLGGRCVALGWGEDETCAGALRAGGEGAGRAGQAQCALLRSPPPAVILPVPIPHSMLTVLRPKDYKHSG